MRNWGLTTGLLHTPFPKALRYPETQERPSFQTWKEIERRIDSGCFSGAQEKELWDYLYLNLDEIRQLLAVIKDRAKYDFLYPMAVMAAYTGARRSELCRFQEGDFDFANGVLTIRETKRARARRTNRQVPISNPLAEAMTCWIEAKRDSFYTFPGEHKVARVRRVRADDDAVFVDEANDQLNLTLANTKWRVIRGWHIFRHSFCSNCASAGVDQRMIDSWVGHQTDEMRKR